METVSEKKTGAVRLEPMPGHIVVRRQKGETTTKGGVVLPDSAIEKSTTGVVLDESPARLEDGTFAESVCKVGDEVLFGSFAGTEAKFDDEEFLILAESEVLAVIRRRKGGK